MPAFKRVRGACLRDYGGEGPDVVFVPSLINPPYILDLAPDRSLIAYCRSRGFRCLMVDWGPAAERADLSLAGHVEHLLLPLVAALDAPPALVGYCLGGTLAIAAAAIAPVRALALIATPWHFSAYGDEARAGLAALWRAAEPLAERLGMLPMEVLQTAFWQLDPARMVGKFERLAAGEADDARLATFVRLEDWANEGEALPAAAAAELLETLFTTDLTGRGMWTIGDSTVAAKRGAVPTLDVISVNDPIVPSGSAAGWDMQMPVPLGHVGMMASGDAPAILWDPLADWLSET